MIEPERMLALWNTGLDMRITSFRIFDMRIENTMFSHSAGACWAFWMKGEEAGMTPLGLFLRLSVEYGFASPGTARQALEQFLLVRGQTWAKDAILALGPPDQELKTIPAESFA